MLDFTSDKFEFWKINDSIRHFYPVGIKKDEKEIYFSYPGIKELDNIIVDNIHVNAHFKERWEDFTKGIGHETRKGIIGTTYGQAPSFSSFVQLEEAFLDNLTRTKEVHFFVSLVGSYYTVIGADINTVKIEEKHYRSINYLVTSPEIDFADTFSLLCDRIESRFKGYRFVPFDICRQVVEGLQVRYMDKTHSTVFNALFNDYLELESANTLGNNFYKLEDWIKEGYIDEGGTWATYPPTG